MQTIHEENGLEGESIQADVKLDDGYGAGLKRHQPVELILRSPMGLRISYDLGMGELEIWISPQAKRSHDAELRNFSNRDDHTRIFDRISFPGLNLSTYQGVDYDPFHSVLHFAQLDLHLVPLVDEPGLLLWCARAELVVDFKSDKQDRTERREAHCFQLRHPDRGLDFSFAAVCAEGSSFFHPPACAVASGRSAYARLALQPMQALLIGGELVHERPEECLADLAGRDVHELLARNEAAVSAGTGRLRARFAGHDDWQRQYDLNLRVLYSAQDHGGWVPAAFRALYYLCWHFDGSIISAWLGQLGWTEYLARWAAFAIDNPTETDTPVPGHFYGQLVTRRISKQEEWGWYCAVWSAFAHHSQTGEARFGSGRYRRKLVATFDWLEAMCWNDEEQAFGFWYAGEDPYLGSHDRDFDAANGRPMSMNSSSHDGKPIARRYCYSGNMRIYSSAWMMSALCADDEVVAGRFRAVAERLEPFLARCVDENINQILIMTDGSRVRVPGVPYHEQPLFFSPHPEQLPRMATSHPTLHLQAIRDGEERFAHHLFQNLLHRDPLIMGSHDLEELLDIFLPQCAQGGKYLQMPGTVIENVNCEDGSYHYNRPQVFATSLMNANMLALGLRRQAFGFALRAAPQLERIDNISWQDGRLDIDWQGVGTEVAGIRIGDQELRHTLQLPAELLDSTRQRITVERSAETPRAQWIASSVRLLSAEERDSNVRWRFEAIGCNHISIRGDHSGLTLHNDSGDAAYELVEQNGCQYLRFSGRGQYELTMQLR